MATDPKFVAFVEDQLSALSGIRSKKMFGEYALYYHEKIVALICDNQVFVKPTISGRGYASDQAEGPPYPGAKNMILIDDKLEDAEWFQKLVEMTAAELPEPKPKKPTSARTKK